MRNGYVICINILQAIETGRFRMCGIVGYIGKERAVDVLIDGLKRLEYRGYDSAGIAVQNGNGIELYKIKGKIRDLQEIIPARANNNIIKGIGHTRWATHGPPSTRNAHPHFVDGVCVVHNGIIENYREIRHFLSEEGARFYSDTDTEVVPHLISYYLKQGLDEKEAILKTLRHLRGSYALGVMIEGSQDRLYAIRNGSPLVVGIGDGEYFFASDIPALLPYTNRFVFLEDCHFCCISAAGIDIEYIGDGLCHKVDIQGLIQEIDWSPSVAEKEGYEHFMLKEIYEQPRAVRDTINEWIDDPPGLLHELGITTKQMLEINRLHIVACGTSYHAALIGKYIIEKLSRIPVDVDIASEYRYREPIIERGTLFISITQSGETADTLAAQREAASHGARTLTICNVVGSTASREADSVLYTRAGPEIGVASTKAFTAQLAALSLLGVALGIKKKRLTNGEVSTLKLQLRKVPDLIEKALSVSSHIKEISRSLIYAKDFLYLGRGINYPIALEGALKLKEISYIHAEGYPAGEMKHGPIALVEEGVPSVFIAPVDELFNKTLSNMEEVKARGGRIIAVTDEPDYIEDKVDDVINVPSAHPLFAPIVHVIPLQLLAYHIAVMRGCNVDQPRNLAKSVTVE